MFEISFGELLLISVVALIVLGPERLPTVARTIGALVGRAQRFVASVKSDIHEQGQMAGLQELKQDVQDAASAFRDQVQREVDDTRQVAQDIAYSVAPVSAAVQASASELAQIAHEANQPSESIAPEDMLAAAGVVSEQQPTVDEGQLDLFAPAATISASDQSVAEHRS